MLYSSSKFNYPSNSSYTSTKNPLLPTAKIIKKKKKI